MPWLTIKAAWQKLDGAISERSILRAARKGTLRGTQIGRRVLVDGDALDELVREGTAKVISPRSKKQRRAE